MSKKRRHSFPFFEEIVRRKKPRFNSINENVESRHLAKFTSNLKILRQCTGPVSIVLHPSDMHFRMLDAIEDSKSKFALLPFYIRSRKEILRAPYSTIQFLTTMIECHSDLLYHISDPGGLNLKPTPEFLHQFEYEDCKKSHDGILFSSSEWAMSYHVDNPACQFLLGSRRKSIAKKEKFTKRDAAIDQLPSTLNAIISSFLTFPLTDSEIDQVTQSITCVKSKNRNTPGWHILFGQEHFHSLIILLNNLDSMIDSTKMFFSLQFWGQRLLGSFYNEKQISIRDIYQLVQVINECQASGDWTEINSISNILCELSVNIDTKY